MWSLLALVLALSAFEARAFVCNSGTGSVYDSSGGTFVVACSATSTCPPTSNCVVGTPFTCDDGGVWTCLVAGANPKWTRSTPAACTATTCVSNVGSIVIANSTNEGTCLGPPATCPIQGCCGTPFDLGALVKCTGTNAGLWFGCVSGAETPAFRPVCNNFCGGATGIIGSTPCTNNCPSTGCCDTAAAQGTTVTCSTGAGAPLTLQCTTPGTTPVYTPVPVTLQCPTASQADATVSYSSKFTAGGGSGSGYNTYAIASGSLPTGLSLNTVNGSVTGSPSATGTFTFTATVKDGAGATGTSLTCTITVSSKPTLSCPSATTADVGLAFSSSFTVFQGATGAKTFAVVQALPPGLTLNTTSGAVTGTPTTAGGFTYQASVTDVAGGTATSLVCTLAVAAQPSLTCPSNLNAATTYSYSGTFTASGGTAPTTCTAGTLPAGLSLTAGTCTVAGTLTATSNSQMCLTLTDSFNQAATRCCTLAVVAPPTPQCFAPNTADAGSLYNNVAGGVQLTISGGSGTGQSWTVVPGSLPAGMTLSSAGVLSGTPSAAGAFSICFTVADSITSPTQSSQLCCPLTIAAAKATLACPATLTAGQGVASSFAWTASGGSGGFTYSTTSALPAGMTLNTTTGVLSGTPTAAFSGSVCVTVTDAAKVTTQTCCTITITGLPSLTCPSASLLNADVNSPTSNLVFAQSGGSGSGYTCAVQSGTTLPAGMSLGASCTVSGTPTTVGNNQQICLTVTDSAGAKANRCCTLVVKAAPVPVCPTQLKADLNQAYVGTPVSGQLSVTGGVGPFTWGNVTGLPTGMTISAGGVLSGTPTASGTFSVCYTVLDTGVTPSVTSAQTCCTLVVSATLALACPATLTGVATTAQSFAWVATGGSGGITFSTSSTLPAGMTFNTSTGVLSGTPTGAFSGSICVIATDAAGVATAQRCCTITISGPPTITCPASMVTAGTGFTWTGVFGTGGGTGALTCSWNGTAPAGLSLNSGTCTVTGTVTANTSVCVKVTDSVGATATICCLLQVVPQPQPQCPPSFFGTAGVALGNGAGIQLTTTGGSPPPTYSGLTVSPAGNSFSLSSSGLITGTPATTGTFSVCYNYTDPSIAPNVLTTCCSLTIVAAAPALACAGPFSGSVSVPASFAWTATAQGAGTLVWSKSSGTIPAGLSLNASTGVISGTPTAAQASTQVCLIATDAALTPSAPVCCNITITAAPTYTCPSNFAAIVNVAFTTTLSPSGGSGAPYTCTLTSFNGTGGTGGWLQVSSGCVITGTPTQTGTFRYCIQVKDSANATFTPASCCSISVFNPATLNCPSQTTLAVNQAFSGQITATSGGTTQVFAFVSSTLPGTWNVVKVGSSYFIQGTPTSNGTGQVCYSYTDSRLAFSSPAQKCCPFTVTGVVPAIACPAVSPILMDLGTTTAVTFTVTNNGSGTLRYAVDTALNEVTVASVANTSNPVITVTPNVTGTGLNLCASVTDAANAKSGVCCPVNTFVALAIACPAGAPFAVDTGSAWSGTWVASGGTGSYTYSNTTALLVMLICLFVCLLTFVASAHVPQQIGWHKPQHGLWRCVDGQPYAGRGHFLCVHQSDGHGAHQLGRVQLCHAVLHLYCGRLVGVVRQQQQHARPTHSRRAQPLQRPPR